MNQGRATRKPLNASTYLLRNPAKSLPFIAVITLAVMLVAGVVAMMNSIPLSIKTIYAYSKEALLVGPRGDNEKLDGYINVIRQESPVPIERLLRIRGIPTVVHSIVGKWPFTVIGLEQQDMDFFLKRNHVSKLNGRLPGVGEAEVLISEPVARNLNLKMGDTLLGPDKVDGYSPFPVKIVGIADTERWFMFGDINYHKQYHFPPIDTAVVFAKNPEDQSKLDHWAEKRFKGERAQVFAYHMLEKDTNQMFKILYQILNIVILTLVLVITIMMAMLMNIYQSQRLVEFGLLQALGYTRRKLLLRVITESILVIVFGWIVGVVCAFGLLNFANASLMYPKAFALDVLDRTAYTYSLPIPIAILLTAFGSVFLRFRKFDPVSVVERRLV